MSISKSLADWVDERLGTREIGQALFGRKVPKAAGAVSWIYTLGSVVMFLFILQAVTGMFLAMNYAPTPENAYDSVRYISEQAPFGAFLRGLHHWGASAMVVAVTLHLLTVFLLGAYKYPRELTWVTGVFLLGIVLFFGFTGYLLPWNEKAYWATLVGTNIAQEAPLVGPAIARLLKGSDELGAQTLTRFYSLHVLLLPAALVACMAVHLFMVVRQGVTAPPTYGGQSPELDVVTQRGREMDKYHAQKEAGEPFYPYLLSKDAAAVVIVFLAIMALAWRFPAEVGQFPDPTDTNYNPRPEWYFLFLFQFLKYFPGSLESVVAVVLPSLVFLGLLVFPFVDRRMVRHPLQRPLATGGACAALLGIIFLTVAGARSPQVSPYVPLAPEVAEGERVYRELHCDYCHSVNGRGGVIGPDLALATEQRHDKSWIVNHLENPQLVVSGKVVSPMGVLPVLLPDQTEALAAYIEELRGGGPYSPLAPVLFKTYCMGCHRLNGHGSTFAPDLSSIGLMRSESFIDRYVENPKEVVGSARMPSFLTPQGPLTHELVEDVARYLAVQRGSIAPKESTTSSR
ncbi:MAG: cytochrome b N-terminal domain-containing protein [Candidatus Binataceae bacterium]